MERSSEIGQLAVALSKAQSEIKGASKDALNPHFKNRYADLASVWDAGRDPLTRNGLSVVQPAKADGANVTVTTILLHVSGEFISEALTLQAQDAKPQSVGSALTYCRRYGFSSMVGIAPEDDDGEAAQGRRYEPAVTAPVAAPVETAPAGMSAWVEALTAVALNGTPALEAAWREAKPEFRAFMTKNQSASWARIKSIAAGKVAA